MKWIFFEEPVSGSTSDEIVENMRSGSRFASEQPASEYMTGVAARVMEYNGCTIRTGSADEFIDDLKTNGLLMPA